QQYANRGRTVSPLLMAAAFALGGALARAWSERPLRRVHRPPTLLQLRCPPGDRLERHRPPTVGAQGAGTRVRGPAGPARRRKPLRLQRTARPTRPSATNLRGSSIGPSLQI